MEGNFRGLMHPWKFIVRENSDATEAKMAAVEATFVEMLVHVHHETREYSRLICRGSGKEEDSKKPFAEEGFMCLYSISEERRS